MARSSDLRAQAVLPVFVFLLLVAVAHQTPNASACGATYCVSLADSVALGSQGVAFQPGLALVSVAQVVAVAFALSPTALVVLGRQRALPRSLLSVAAHLRGLTRAPASASPTRTRVAWLPIESICSGRLTSRMLRAPSFFGPGRP